MIGDMDVLNTLCIFNLGLCSVANEYGLSTPFDDNVLALGDRAEVEFDFGLGQYVG